MHDSVENGTGYENLMLLATTTRNRSIFVSFYGASLTTLRAIAFIFIITSFNLLICVGYWKAKRLW